MAPDRQLLALIERADEQHEKAMARALVDATEHGHVVLGLIAALQRFRVRAPRDVIMRAAGLDEERFTRLLDSELADLVAPAGDFLEDLSLMGERAASLALAGIQDKEALFAQLARALSALAPDIGLEMLGTFSGRRDEKEWRKEVSANLRFDGEKDHHTLHKRAIALVRAGLPEEARAAFRNLIRDNPQDYASYHALAELEEKLDNLGTADVAFSARWCLARAIELDPRLPHAWLTMARLSLRAAGVNRAEPHDPAAQAKPNLGSLDDEASARAIFRRGLEATGFAPEILRTWAMLEEEAGILGEPAEDPPAYSARWLRIMLTELQPGRASNWIGWAIREAEVGRFGSSEREPWSARWLAMRATEVEPGNSRAWSLRGDAERGVGRSGPGAEPRPEHARRAYTEAIARDPENSHPLLGLAALLRAERYQITARAKGSTGQSRQSLYARVEELRIEEIHLLNRALPLLQTARDRRTLSRAFCDLSKAEPWKGIAHLRNATEADDSNAIAWSLLGRSLGLEAIRTRDFGLIQEAEAVFARALARASPAEKDGIAREADRFRSERRNLSV